MLRTWKIDEDMEDASIRIGNPSTPIITIVPSVEAPQKIQNYPEKKMEIAESNPAIRDASIRVHRNPFVSALRYQF